jgi:hypothetical protein
MKKSIAALALAGTIALTGAVPAMAANYPAPGTRIGNRFGRNRHPGQVFTFSGTGFLAGETITITITLTVAPQALGGGFSGGAACRFRPRSTCCCTADLHHNRCC